jgi:hypothetical protein
LFLSEREVMKYLVAILLLALTAVAAASEVTIPIPTYNARRIEAAADGTIWFVDVGPASYVDRTGIVGRVRPDGTVETTRVPRTTLKNIVPAMMPVPDGGLLLGWENGGIVKVDADMRVTVRPRFSGFVILFVPLHDGTYWFVDNDGRKGRVGSDGVVLQEAAMHPTFDAATASADGTIYGVAADGFYRGGTDGAFEKIAACSDCQSTWLEVMNDGSILSRNAKLLRDGTLLRHDHYYPEDAVIGPDGHLWMAGPSNVLTSVDASGNLRQFPLLDPQAEVRAITKWNDEVVALLRGGILRVKASARRDLAFRNGDLLALERSSSYHGLPVSFSIVMHHRRGAEPFARKLLWDPASDDIEPASGDVFAASTARAFAMGSGLVSLDGFGSSSPYCTDWVPALAFVVDEADTMYVIANLGHWVESDMRLLTIDAAGVKRRDIPLPDGEALTIGHADLAADQCTLFYLSGNRVARLNACSGTGMPAFLSALPETPLDIRLTRSGDVVIAFASRVVRYDRFGIEREALTPGATAIALDPDPRFLWVGRSALERVQWETGAIVERLPIHGGVESLSIFGEPRAARVGPPRRRATSH